MVKWVALLLNFHVILSSNLVTEAAYPDDVHGLLHTLQANSRAVPQARPQLFPSTYLPIHYSLIILPLNGIQFGRLTVQINK
jgi:hypothetical protein